MTDWTVLAAYPARIRRKHGAELIDTMVEMAGPGGRPTAAAKRMLMLDGLRERFRPPVRRPFALVAAILALLVGGALGAAAGSWLGTTGYTALPDGAALAQRVLSGPVDVSAGDRYLHISAAIPDGTDAATAAESARRELAAEGWRTGPLTTGDGSDGVLANVHFTAENDDTQLSVYAYPNAGDVAFLSLAGWPQRPTAYVPLTIAGALLGLLAGWLSGVALGHRIQAAGRPMIGALLAGLGFALVIPSAIGFVVSLARYLTISEPLGTGELLHADGFAFGPTRDMFHAYDLGEGWILTPGDFSLLPLWGFALIIIAAIVSRPAQRTDHQAVA